MTHILFKDWVPNLVLVGSLLEVSAVGPGGISSVIGDVSLKEIVGRSVFGLLSCDLAVRWTVAAHFCAAGQPIMS